MSAGLELRFAAGRPVVALRGVSLWGVPIPNAWLGGIKNLDLVKEFGGQRAASGRHLPPGWKTSASNRTG